MYYINIVSSQNSVVFCILLVNSNSFTNKINTCYLTFTLHSFTLDILRTLLFRINTSDFPCKPQPTMATAWPISSIFPQRYLHNETRSKDDNQQFPKKYHIFIPPVSSSWMETSSKDNLSSRSYVARVRCSS